MVPETRTAGPLASAARPWVAIAAVVLGASIAFAAPARAQTGNYIVGPQDVLLVTVWEQPELSGKFTVEADGAFTYPLVGRVQAGNRTQREIETEVARLLVAGELLRKPQVTVAVDAYRSQRVYVIGEVRSPGRLELSGVITLMDALTRAGGLQPTASSEVLVVRPTSTASSATGPTQPDAGTVTKVDVDGLQSGALESHVTLRDGDTVIVRRAETVFVSGQVNDPGEYPLRKGVNVLQLLTLAGGITDRGSLGRIKIVRVVNGKKEEKDAKEDDLVQPGDTIIVRERFF